MRVVGPTVVMPGILVHYPPLPTLLAPLTAVGGHSLCTRLPVVFHLLLSLEAKISVGCFTCAIPSDQFRERFRKLSSVEMR